VHVAEQAAPPSKSVREFAAFGMWADREDIPTASRMWNPRLREPGFRRSRLPMAYLIDSDVMVDFTRETPKPPTTWIASATIACSRRSPALELIAGARNQREVTDLDS